MAQALPVEAQLARWDEYLDYRPDTNELDDPSGLLVHDQNGGQGLCPVALTTPYSETLVVSPTIAGVDTPKICGVGYYETAFWYAKPDDNDNDTVTEHPPPETSADSRADLPTLSDWASAVLHAHKEDRFTRKEPTAYTLDLTDRSGFAAGQIQHTAPDVVYRYPWPIYAPTRS